MGMQGPVCLRNVFDVKRMQADGTMLGEADPQASPGAVASDDSRTGGNIPPGWAGVLLEVARRPKAGVFELAPVSRGLRTVVGRVTLLQQRSFLLELLLLWGRLLFLFLFIWRHGDVKTAGYSMV